MFRDIRQIDTTLEGLHNVIETHYTWLVTVLAQDADLDGT